jgi:hypothetical protein
MLTFIHYYNKTYIIMNEALTLRSLIRKIQHRTTATLNFWIAHQIHIFHTFLSLPHCNNIKIILNFIHE